jgi:hypothetical protein
MTIAVQLADSHWTTTYTLAHRSQRVEAQPSLHVGEALFGGPTHGARTNAASRAEHLAWPPVWDGAS